MNKKYIYCESFCGTAISGNSIILAKYLALALELELVIGVVDQDLIKKEGYCDRNGPVSIINDATIVVLNSHVFKEGFNPTGTVIQTWHGTPLKKLGLGLKFNPRAYLYVYRFSRELKKTNLFIFQNEFAKEILSKSFAYKGNKLVSGYPTTDVLLELSYKKTLTKLKVKGFKKIILFAPTWRDDRCYKEDGKKIRYFSPLFDIQKVSQTIGEDTLLLIKPHSMETKINDCDDLPNNVRLMTNQPIEELMVVADVLITDYSSIYFDYQILKKPIIFYVPDLEVYKNKTRGFNIEYKPANLPGYIVNNEPDLIMILKRINLVPKGNDKLIEKYSKLDDGHACERILKWVNENTNV